MVRLRLQPRSHHYRTRFLSSTQQSIPQMGQQKHPNRRKPPKHAG